MMKLVYDEMGERFVLVCSYAERQTAKDAGFRWDAEGKVWYTHTSANAMCFMNIATPQALEALGVDHTNTNVPLHIQTLLREYAKRLCETWSCPVCLDTKPEHDMEIKMCGHFLCNACSRHMEEAKCPVCRTIS